MWYSSIGAPRVGFEPFIYNVPLRGIEPLFQAPEACVLSVERQGLFGPSIPKISTGSKYAPQYP